MSLSHQERNTLIMLVQQLYQHIRIEEYSERLQYSYAYSQGFGANSNLVIDFSFYQAFLDDIFSLPGIFNCWSQFNMRFMIQELLDNVGKIKLCNAPNVDIKEVIEQWLLKIDVDFDERECYVPVIGLTVDKPFEIGQITFWPLDSKKEYLLTKMVRASIFEGLFPHRDCIASGMIKAEKLKSAELIRLSTDSALNLLRYLASLKWLEQPHFYVAGYERPHSSSALSLGKKGDLLVAGYSVYTSPVSITDDFIEFGKSYKLSYLQSLFKKEISQRTDLEHRVLLALNWFGDACQDISPQSAFLKYYIPLEIIGKREDESARPVLPNRISMLAEPYDKNKQRNLRKELENLVEERNEIFHGGQPSHKSIEQLQTFCRNVSSKAISGLVREVALRPIQTFDEFIKFIDDNRKPQVY